MTRWTWIGGVLVSAALLGGCASTDSGGGSGGDCESHYEPVAEAATWPALRAAMLDADGWGHVASLRTQSDGDDIDGRDADVVRVVDLLNAKGRRLAQAEVWRTDDGWAAGVWSQCID